MAMDFNFENFGFIKNGKITLNDLTIIFGGNNCGKTYLDYAIYGILDDAKQLIEIPINKDAILKEWKDKQVIQFSIKEIQDKININSIANNFTENLDDYFNTKDYFKNSNIGFSLEKNKIQAQTNEESFGELNKQKIHYELNYSDNYIKIWTTEFFETPDRLILYLLNNLIYEFLYSQHIPSPFIVTSERTGISLFYKELDFTKNQIIELLKKEDTKQIDLLELLENKSSSYPQPIKDNIDLVRNYENIKKRKSFITKKSELSNDNEYSKLLAILTDIVGGSFKTNKQKEIQYFSNLSKKLAVPFHITASATKSLFLIDLYLRHLASVNDILIIDEPELHLSIANQRKMAGLITGLVNLGIKCLITTHSDFLVREINNRIMLEKHTEQNLFLKKYNIESIEIIASNKVSAYEITTKGKIILRENNLYGVNTNFFDNVIADSNKLSFNIVEKI